MLDKSGLTLALGGGGVKCFAHLGVLKKLESEGVPIRGMAATSAAAIIAALYSLGYPIHAIRDLLSGLKISRLIRPGPQERESLFGLRRVREFFDKHFDGIHFQDLKIPLSFPVVDLSANRIRNLHSGPLSEALLAAIAIPGLFPPQYRGSQKLIDGGVLAPVPVSLARALAPGAPVAAVILNPSQDRWDEHPFPQLVRTVPWLRLLARLRFTRALGVYVQACDLTNRLLAEELLEKQGPQVIIRPEVGHLGLFDRVEIDQLVHQGELAAGQGLAQLRAWAKSPERYA